MASWKDTDFLNNIKVMYNLFLFQCLRFPFLFVIKDKGTREKQSGKEGKTDVNGRNMPSKIVNNFSCKGKRKNMAPRKGSLRKGAGLPRGKKQGKLRKRTYLELPADILHVVQLNLKISKRYSLRSGNTTS